MLKQAMERDYEGAALLLARAAKIVRKEILSHNGFRFEGDFHAGCQQESLPFTLKTFVSMLLNCADLKDQASIDSQAILTVSQPFFSTSRNMHHLLQSLGIPWTWNLHYHYTSE